ncbi:3-oxoacyl-ACP reductase FabG [Agrobacterium sp. fls2-241-TYG-188a]|uniref:3-oxoacyl-ACP reductase FabG n=1 Tax=Agrobacterium sp. fls2-241-TYG-188a TaxID=3040275 RepID=UPI00254AB442|nr:3-oxoacyl-ACP reductase FabG [Agrobacterium sp. fls2-241-TYG-188a]
MIEPRERRTAIVAGGTSGIGLSVVQRLLDLGYRVAAFGHTESASQAARSTLGEALASGRALIGKVDVKAPREVTLFCQTVGTVWGSADTMVYCVGISPKDANGSARRFGDVHVSEWDEVIATNLTGAFLCAQATIGAMASKGFGRIVLIGSLAARTRPRVAGVAYAVSKAGLGGLARALVSEFASAGVTVNVVAPGRIMTPMSGSPISLINIEAMKRIPTGRLGVTEDVSAAVAFLVSEEASFINGAILDVNGGEFVPT